MRKPMIGITSALNEEESYYLINREFFEVLMAAGATPVLVPMTDDEEVLQECVNRLDGFLFSGGGDVDPMTFGEYLLPACGSVCPMRDRHELTLARLLMQRRDKPVLGICRGVQVLNIALGGDVYQDLPSQYEGKIIAHRQTQLSTYASHPVEVKKDSLLYRICKHDSLMVNSLHHQAVRRPGRWKVCAQAPDGVIEGAEMQEHPFFMGVQWHPERLWRKDPLALELFKAFVQACTPAEE